MNDNSDSRNSNAGYADENSIELDHNLAHMLRSLPQIAPSVDFARGIETRIRSAEQQNIGQRQVVVNSDIAARNMAARCLPSRKIYSAIKTWTEDFTRPWVFGLALNGALLLSLTFLGNNTDTSLLSRATTHQTETYTDATVSELDFSDTLLSYSDNNWDDNWDYNGDHNGEDYAIETIDTFWEDYLPKEEV